MLYKLFFSNILFLFWMQQNEILNGNIYLYDSISVVVLFTQS